jgi:ubiquinone/menaquinone biosynthesis C-methylase UbiE
MPGKPDPAVEIQRRYYTDTAARYDSMHAQEGCGDPAITKFVSALLQMLEVRSVLDVGTATGRGMRDLKRALPGVFVCGVEPVAALVDQAAQSGNTAGLQVIRATGDALPFANGSFDAVCEFAVLHHVANPSAVVKEMLRVAKKAVFLCDSNRFGQGSSAAKYIKLALYKSGLWGVYNFLRTGGKGYTITEGDGLAYSYSVYDSFGLISRWADRLILIPSNAGEKGTSWFHPLFNSGGVLVCAMKEKS